jgi:manganese transport protein
MNYPKQADPLPEAVAPRGRGVPWRHERHGQPAGVHGTIPVPVTASFWRKLFAFAGPGIPVAVGYMDPGNWASDIAGGARFGYTLLSMIMLSNLMALLLQALSARLGIASGRDLAQACRDAYSRPVTIGLWLLCEIAIAACDLAEVLGAAIALNLLFGIPLLFGVCLTALDVIIVLSMQHRGFRYVEGLVVLLILGIAGCFAVELWLGKPRSATWRAASCPRSRSPQPRRCSTSPSRSSARR